MTPDEHGIAEGIGPHAFIPQPLHPRECVKCGRIEDHFIHGFVEMEELEEEK